MGFFKNLFGNKKKVSEIPQKKAEKVANEIEDEPYGIDKDNAHERAVELIPEEFFWSCVDELAPFGSDEGDTALSEFRDWKKDNPNTETFECIRWTIEGVSEKNLAEYNEKILDRTLIKSQLEDENFNDQQYIFTVDISVIATGFAQLVDEGKIDEKNKPIIQLAIDRQKIWAELATEWEYGNEYIEKLKVLNRALKVA